MLFGTLHHLHNFGIAGVDGPFFRADDQCRFAIDGSGENLGTRSFGHHIGFAGEVGFVHHPVPFDDDSIYGTDFVGKDGNRIVNGDLIQSDILNVSLHFFMSDRRHAFTECL